MEGFIYLAVLAILYFLPAGLASSRKHPSYTGIMLLNLFLGWTIIGWIVALVWAGSGPGKAGMPTPDTHVKCPDCRELIIKEAKVCKHCGCRLVPQA